MKTILSAALVLGICGLAVVQGEKADPVGTWKCEYEIGDMKRTSTLTIKKDGDKLAGTMSWPDQKETKLKDVKLKGGDLTFSAEREVMDNKFTVEYKFTINGDKLKGKGAVEVGGEKREFDIEGKRGEEGQVAVDGIGGIQRFKARQGVAADGAGMTASRVCSLPSRPRC